MRTSLILILLGLAAGCATPTRDPAETACRRAAYDDPDVQEQILRSNSQHQQTRGPALIELDRLVRLKTRDCLGRSGPSPRGGVEPLKAS